MKDLIIHITIAAILKELEVSNNFLLKNNFNLKSNNLRRTRLKYLTIFIMLI